MESVNIELPPEQYLTPDEVQMYSEYYNNEYWAEVWAKMLPLKESDPAAYSVAIKKLEDDFMKVDKYREDKKEIRDKAWFEGQINSVTGRLDNMLDKLGTNDQHIKELQQKHESLLINDRRHDARLTTLEHQALNMEVKLSHVESHTKQIPALIDSINKLHGTVNIALQQSTTQPKPTASPQAKPKLSTVLSSIPTAGYIVGGVVSIALFSAATGHLGEFFAWLGSAKILGGVK